MQMREHRVLLNNFTGLRTVQSLVTKTCLAFRCALSPSFTPPRRRRSMRNWPTSCRKFPAIRAAVEAWNAVAPGVSKWPSKFWPGALRTVSPRHCPITLAAATLASGARHPPAPTPMARYRRSSPKTRSATIMTTKGPMECRWGRDSRRPAVAGLARPVLGGNRRGGGEENDDRRRGAF